MTFLRPHLEKIDALTPRERVILFVLLLAGIWAVLDGLLLGPQDKARQTEKQRLEAAASRIQAAQDALGVQASRPDPAQAARQRLEAARSTLAARSEETRATLGRLAPARDMARVLEGLLRNRPGLRLARLETAPPEPVGVAPGAKPEEAALFRHVSRLTLAGDYDALVRYMESLERLPAGFYWERAELDATKHPDLSLTLTLATLSMDRPWLTF